MTKQKLPISPAQVDESAAPPSDTSPDKLIPDPAVCLRLKTMEKTMRNYDNYEKPMPRKVDLVRTTEPPVKSHPQSLELSVTWQ